MTRSPGKSATKPTSPSQKFTPPPQNFVSAFYANAMPSDLELFSASDRMQIAASSWGFASMRAPGGVSLRIFNPSIAAHGWTVDHTVIEIVHDDMPFLVDSVTGVLQKRGLSVHFVFHPVIPIVRDGKGKALSVASEQSKGAQNESFLHIQIDHCFDTEELRALESDVLATLLSVRDAVSDWNLMRDRALEAAGDVVPSASDLNGNSEEISAFMRWLSDDNFTFLGYRELSLEEKVGATPQIRVLSGRGLGVLRDDEMRMFGGLRDPKESRASELIKYQQHNEALSVMKTVALSRVHRIVPMDAIFVRRFDEKGQVTFERLFVGLFTYKTYAQTPRQIPLVRHKIANVISRLNFAPRSHNGRNLMQILCTYPHDELFQIAEDDLYANVLGILQLQERAHVALYLRRDRFDRYVTYLLYVPRERYDSALRERVQSYLENAFKGTALSWQARIDDSLLARAFGTICLTPDSPHPDLASIEQRVGEMCRTWTSRLRDLLVKTFGEAPALALLSRYGNVFPKAYQEAVDPADAAHDLRHLDRMRKTPQLVINVLQNNDGRLRLRLLQPERPLLLSESLPLIENMGLKIDYMGGPHEIKLKDSASVFVHEFVGVPALPCCLSFERAKPVLEEALTRVFNGDVENDSFNGLSLRIGLDWRNIVLLRAFARYLRQLRIPYSHEMIASALLAHPRVAQQLCALFLDKHDPALKKNDRASKMDMAERALQEALTKISVLEEDRIVRRYLNLVHASLRTNYFQHDENDKPKTYLSIKFDSSVVEFMPLPKPLYEIFVYSPRVEAIHLRGGKVARGGIRWSDRRDDFRNEILGLMKAQMVKNTVIVPVGSKGGFIVKRPPAEADKMQSEGIACYKLMINGLLDLTDNYVDGKISPPPNVVRHDADDPYLVVAADKGTATFSDIANGVSRARGFWLDDAFASGGSAGYDHKVMGITARGAWEAIKRHFRELGKDIQKESFTCIGVGDMSGDVFGNGMLLSTQTLLLGAFDHRHIFIDPTPNAAKSFAERKRLFALPKSSWNDYNRNLISKGGGIFARTEKTIKITPEMKKAFGLNADALSPPDLIRELLKASVELIYFGGIGTYVKASSESHLDVGDRANEALRIDATELKAKVVGEGANLGLTQRGRIEYALAGGRLNTDAIDNSAGVDTSDHEVNIKLLLRRALDKKSLTFASRDKLLASMADEVGKMVLKDNYLQTQALSIALSQAPDLLPAHTRCIQFLESEGLLNRAIEFLPTDMDLAGRREMGKGLTRPELAVIMAYAKLWLYQKMLDSELPDDPVLQKNAVGYFPEALRRTYIKDIAQHHLRREIAATVATNDIVNRAGAEVILSIADHGDVASVVRAYIIVRDAMELPQLWAEIEALDGKTDAAIQARLFSLIRSSLSCAMERLLASAVMFADLGASIETYRRGIKQLAKAVSSETAETLKGVPDALSAHVARLPVLVKTISLIDLSERTEASLTDLSSIFFNLGKRLEIDWLCQTAAEKAQTAKQREILGILCEKLARHHRLLTEKIATGKNPSTAHWERRNADKLKDYDLFIAKGRASPSDIDLTTLLRIDEKLSAL